MTNTIGRLDFELTAMPRVRKSDELPFSPFVNLCLATRCGDTRHGFPLISPRLMTHQEVDEYVCALKADLDAVALRAKRALSSHS